MNFERLYELKELCNEFEKSCNCYFDDLDDLLKNYYSYYKKLVKTLNRVDETSWNILKSKCIPYLCLNNSKRGWSQLFDILNEAKGYGYLLDKGCKRVKFIKKSSVETPDLEGLLKEEKLLCEVKTLNKSDLEIERREKLIAKEVEFNLNEGLKSQLEKIIKKAKNQLKNYNVGNVRKRIVYILVDNDDWQPCARSRINKQINSFANKFVDDGIEVKIDHI